MPCQKRRRQDCLSVARPQQRSISNSSARSPCLPINPQMRRVESTALSVRRSGRLLMDQLCLAPRLLDQGRRGCPCRWCGLCGGRRSSISSQILDFVTTACLTLSSLRPSSLSFTAVCVWAAGVTEAEERPVTCRCLSSQSGSEQTHSLPERGAEGKGRLIRNPHSAIRRASAQ